MTNKVALITDTHFDIGNGNEKIYQQQIKFIKYMFEYMKENDIKMLFHLGDFFHNRQHMSVNIMNHIVKDFLHELYDNDITLHIITGNHDVFTKTTNEINSLYPLMYDDENIHLYDKQTEIMIGDTTIGLVPWIHDDSKFEVPNTDIIMGHFEMKHFMIMKNYDASEGLNPDMFGDRMVLSGHYHIKQSKGNIHYLGSPYQNNWSDFNNPRGFHVLDLKTKELDFIPNDISTKHIKVILDNTTKSCSIEGFEDTINTKVTKKFNFNIFKDHKVKVFSTKELAFVKNFIDEVEKVAMNVKLELIKEEKELKIDEIIQKIEEQDISKKLISVVDEEDQDYVMQLIKEAQTLMLEDN